MNLVSPMWKFNGKRTSKLSDDLNGLQAVMRSELYSVQSDRPMEQEQSAKEWERILDERYHAWRPVVEGLGESVLVPKEFCFWFHGRYVSLDFYKKLLLALEVLQDNPQCVLEIGAGYGQVQRLLHHLKPDLKLIVIDLPETLRWAKLFLEGMPCEFIPADQFGKPTGHIDCLLNSSSFGEMPEAVCEQYLKMFSYVPRMVLLNRLLNTYCPWREQNREREGHWYFYLPLNREVESWELEPDFTRIPGPEFTGHHRELFIVLNKSGQIRMPSTDEVRQQSWFTRRTRSPSGRAANILGPDPHTLRTLLEAVRWHWPGCSPNGVVALDALLWYLQAISLRRPFEELPMLWKRYQDWTGARHATQSLSWSLTQPLRPISTRLAQFIFQAKSNHELPHR